MSVSKEKLKLTMQLAAALFLGALLLVTCGKVDTKSEISLLTTSVPFVDAYSSLMTLEQVRSNLGVSQVELEKILEPGAGSRRRTSETQLMHTWFEIHRENALLGFSGKLQFEFYHDRLARVIFSPPDVGDFLSRALKVKVNPTLGGHVSTTTPALRIAYGANHVVWMDERIMAILENAD